jgi:hypothetical protein
MPPHNAPQREPEVSLRELGCPYSAEDPRALAWIAGYRTGHHACYEASLRISEQVFSA